jgi:hypothetical protein
MDGAELVDLAKRAEAMEALRVMEAREDCSKFIEYVLTHEETGADLRNAPLHERWQNEIEENRFAVIMAAVEHAKSQQIAVGRVLYELGKTRPCA